MKKLFTHPRLRVLSAVFSNLTAGWIGAIFILPNFSDLAKIENQLILLINVICATVSLMLAFWFEERSEK